MNITEDLFKASLGSFPTGVTVITTTDGIEHYGITISSFSSLSLSPPLVLFSLNKSSYYHNSFTQCEHFAINILSDSQAAISSHFAQHQEGRWSNIKHKYNQHQCALIDNSTAQLECQRYKVYDGGDHSIIIGKVEHATLDESKTPLLYFKGKYPKLDTQSEKKED
jgi:flavin reductase (DIM6/NTAB) family NADH-FMN oxidoreductase RutF